MKKLLFLSFISGLLFFGCSSSDSPTGANGGLGGLGGGLGTGGGNTGNVTVGVQVVQDNQQQVFFEFTPSATVFMKLITANCAAAGVNNEQVTVNLSSSPNDPINVGPLTVVQQGQQWSFTISGNVGTEQGTAFSYSTNYTVQ